MIDIQEFSNWLKQVLGNTTLYNTLFIANMALNLAVFLMIVFNILANPKKYSVYIFIMSATITISHFIVSNTLLGVINKQFHYLCLHYVSLAGIWILYFLIKLPKEKTFLLFFITTICHIILTFYISFLSVVDTNTILLHGINLLLKGFLYLQIARFGHKASINKLLPKQYIILNICVAISICILDFPPIFHQAQTDIFYTIKLTTFCINVLLHCLLVAYLTAKLDKELLLEQQKIIEDANQNQEILLKETLTLEQELAKQQNEIQATTIHKNKLFSSIGHDLKNTIYSLKIALNIFDEKTTVDEDTKQLQAQLDGIYGTLDNVFELATLYRNNLPNYRDISLKDVIEDSLVFMNHNLLNKNIRVIKTIEDATICANEHQMRVVMRNLLSNAIKFSPKNSFIRVAASTDEKQVTLLVVDAGIGMCKKILTTIADGGNFQSTLGTEGETGTGLGLILCKKLIESHSGTLEIESEVNKGTHVKIKFLAIKPN